MQELRFVAVSEDGRYAVLAVPGRSARFTLPIDERLRAVAQGQTSRLAQYEIEVESPLRPKEIQARIRAGETVEEIADAAGIAIERVRWFEGPVLAERAYVAEQAQAASVRRQGDATPGPRLGEVVTERLHALHADPDEARWDAKKRGDGSWQVELTFTSGERLHTAEWLYDQRRRHVLPADDTAVRMSLPGAELPQPAEPHPGEATVTQLAPRLSPAVGQSGAGYIPGHVGPGQQAPGHTGAGHGGSGYPAPGSSGPGGNGGRPRHERPAAPRPSVPEPPRPAPASPVSAPAAAEPRTARHSYPAADRSGSTDRSGPTERPAASERPAAQVQSRPQDRPAATPPVSPASVAAQVSRVTQAPRQARDTVPDPQAARPQAPAAEPPRAAEPSQATRPARPDRPEQMGASSRQEPAHRQEPGGREGPGRPAQAPAAAVPPPPTPAAEPAPEAAEPAGRSGRKAVRGKRSSVPSWDEIMFGNRRD